MVLRSGLAAFLLVIILMLMALASHAQYRYSRIQGPSYIALHGGFTQGLGAFGRMESNYSYGTFAKNGSHIGLEGAYFYSENIGFGTMLRANYHTVDSDKLADEYLKDVEQWIDASAEVEPFLIATGLMGFFLDLPTNEYFSFTFKLMAGLTVARKPWGKVNLTAIDLSQHNRKESSAWDSQFTLLNSIGTRINLNQWSIHVNIDYMGTKFHFDYTTAGYEQTLEQHIRLISYNLAIAYRFNYFRY